MGAGALQVNRRNLFLALAGLPLLPCVAESRTITVSFQGVFTMDAAREIAEQLKDVIDRGDTNIVIKG